MAVKAEIVVDLRRGAAAPAHAEPVTVGVPFAPGMVGDTAQLAVRDGNGRLLPSQVEVLARWREGTVRWALVDVVIAAGAHRREPLVVQVHADAMRVPSELPGLAWLERDGAHVVDTGRARATIPRDVAAALVTVQLGTSAGAPTLRSRIILEDADGRQLQPRLEAWRVEADGPVRLTLRGAGEFRRANGTPFCRFVARISCFRGTALVRLDFTVHNPRRATHSGGVWDLGDPGSILFRDLSLAVTPTPSAPYRLAWRAAPDTPEQRGEGGHVTIYQASSGGDNWTSRNHVDRSGTVPLPFRGGRITHGGGEEPVVRASPVVARAAAGVQVSAAVTKFWQQFPKTLDTGADGLRLGLFPRQAGTLFELQGGEQKTHTIFLLVEPAEQPTTDGLTWVHDPLVPCLPPQYYADSEAFPYFVPRFADPHTDYVALVDAAVDGPHSFFGKREVIDEYGWRHFGDTYADHEDVHFHGEHPIISHYNNQYDVLSGLLLHFARAGDPRWFELAADLARHIIDIDIYHTTEDKPAYNGGLFWHTEHYQSAGRATHRSYSADSPEARKGRAYGGGPGNEHNYTTGLLHFYYLTGDIAARDAVLELADWVIQMDDGTRSLLGYLDPGPSGIASCTADFSYHGPGRGAGNSLNALLDAYGLTGDRRYLDKAEQLIARCIHPHDDIEERQLRDAERRWSYLVFLQALGKYLDRKSECGQRDQMFAYARASLIRYARWMLANEEPFLAHADHLEYPTETWPAQDVRKSCVFDYAAKYGPAELRAAFTDKAETFFQTSIDGVQGFATRACTRPLALLLANGVQRAGFDVRPPEPIPPCPPDLDFGVPSGFLSQKDRVKRQLRRPSGWLTLARALVRPSVLSRILSGRIW